MNGDAVRAALATAVGSVGSGAIWVGYSGGLDSTVLLDAAMRVAGPGTRIAPVHVDHGLHPDSGRWAAHCVAWCERRGVECGVHPVTVARRGSLENAAREARYRVFADLLGPGDLLLLGHHADDQSETVLFRMVRGSAAPGAGMAAQRRLGAGVLLRPLLALPRRALESYARERSLDWLEDPANLDVRHDRNYLRREVLPRLAERWPGAAMNIARSARTRAADTALLERLLGHELEAVRRSAGLDVERLLAFAAPARLLRFWLARQGLHGTRERALAELLRQLEDPGATAELRVAEGVALRSYGGCLSLVRETPRGIERWVWDWVLDGPRIQPTRELPHGLLAARRTLGPGLRCGRYRVVLRRGGERIKSTAQRSTSVKQLLNEAAIPPWRRRTYPLIYADRELVAIPGIGTAASYRAAGGWELEWRPDDGFHETARGL